MTCIEIHSAFNTHTRALHSSGSSLWKRLGGPITVHKKPVKKKRKKKVHTKMWVKIQTNLVKDNHQDMCTAKRKKWAGT